MDTWGISGPQFLLLYVALAAVTVAVAALARRRALAGPPGAATPSRLDPYEAAFLNGGSALVATTAVTSLLRDGLLTSTSRRGRRVRLSTRAAPPAGAHPVEWATYQLVAAQPNRTLASVQVALGREPAVAAVRERLRLGGLAATPEQRARYRAAGLWFVPLLALGVARVAAGAANGRPVGFLVALVAVTVVVAVVPALRVPDVTELGRRTLRRLRADTSRPTGRGLPGRADHGHGPVRGRGPVDRRRRDRPGHAPPPRVRRLRRRPRGGGDGGGGSCGGGGCGGGCGGGGCGG